MFRFLNYYRLIGVMFFLGGLELMSYSSGFLMFKCVGMFLLFVGAYDVITGRSMKMSSSSGGSAGKAQSSQNTEKENKAEKETFKFNKKTISKYLLNKNLILSLLMLLAAFLLFKSSDTFTKKLFSFGNANTNINFSNNMESTGIDTSTAEPVVEAVNLSKAYLKNQVIIKIKSIEKTPQTTYLNISIENNSKYGVQLYGLDKFQIIDSNNNSYKLDLTSLDYPTLDTMDGSTLKEFRLPFMPCDSSSKIIKFKGQFWALVNGVQEVPFEITFN